VNFNSIVNGTIDGRLEFSVSSGSVFVDRLDQVDVRLARPPDSFGFRQRCDQRTGTVSLIPV
jgi:hypothetical protein